MYVLIWFCYIFFTWVPIIYKKTRHRFSFTFFFLFFLKENKIIRVRDTISYFAQSVTDGPINGSVEKLTDQLRQWLIESRARD